MIRIKDMPANAIVKGSDFNALKRMVEQSQTIICGPGLETRRTSAGNCISLIHGRLDRARATGATPIQEGTRVHIFARILGWRTAQACQYLGVQHIIGWEYDYEEVVKQDNLGISGYWMTRPDGLAGKCYNTLEAMNVGPSVNDDEAVAGPGIGLKDLWDNYPNFDLVPAPIGAVVILWQTPNYESNEWWFQYENSVEGTCA